MSNQRNVRFSTAKTTVKNRLCTSRGADVASAATLTLGNDGNYFSITGTTNIDYITTTDWTPGSVVHLKFNGSLTLNHNTGTVPANTAALTLAAAGNVSVTADDMITLVYDGSTWRQLHALLAI